MKDAIGCDIVVGSYVCWPSRSGSSIFMNHGTVVKISDTRIDIERSIPYEGGVFVEKRYTKQISRVFVCMKVDNEVY